MKKGMKYCGNCDNKSRSGKCKARDDKDEVNLSTLAEKVEKRVDLLRCPEHGLFLPHRFKKDKTGRKVEVPTATEPAATGNKTSIHERGDDVVVPVPRLKHQQTMNIEIERNPECPNCGVELEEVRKPMLFGKECPDFEYYKVDTHPSSMRTTRLMP